MKWYRPTGWAVLCGCIWLCVACDSTKYLEPGQALLRKNRIVLTDRKAVRNPGNLADQLSYVYKQKPNGKIFWIPREWIWLTSPPDSCTTRLGRGVARWEKRLLGEPPAIYDPQLTEATRRAMVNYLRHRGYFLAQAEYEARFDKDSTKAYVTYRVAAGPAFVIDTVTYETRDTAIAPFLPEIAEGSLLQPGLPVSAERYELEVQRITRLLRNKGFAFFYPQHVDGLEGDSVGTRVRLRLEILPPAEGRTHQRFRIRHIVVYPDYRPLPDTFPYRDTLIDGIHYRIGPEGFPVKPKTIGEALFIGPGQWYHFDRVERSRLRLGELGIYRNVGIRPEPLPEQAGLLDLYIYLTPNEQWELGLDMDINVNTSQGKSIVSAPNLLGFSLSPSLKSRNLLHGAELLVSNIQGLFEVDAVALLTGEDTVNNNIDFKVQAELLVPRFVDFGRSWQLGNRLGLISDKVYRALRSQATTRFSLSYNLIRLPQYYDYNLFNGTFYSYDLNLSPREHLYVSHFGIDYLSPSTRPAFDSILATSPFLQRSFARQLITGVLFRNFTWTRRTPLRHNHYWSLQLGLEQSGLEVWLGNKLANAIGGRTRQWTFFEIPFSQFVRLNLDLAWHQQFKPRESIGLRMAAGIIAPFGNADEVPYLKQFWVGGPNSIRGWPARALGPGRYRDPLTANKANRPLFYQTGNIVLEGNVEYRFKVLEFWGQVYEGALFVDAGNVWTLREDPDRPGSKFFFANTYDEAGQLLGESFLKQLAVSAGFGIRWDATYFVVRSDWGLPIRNNYPDEEGRFWRHPGTFKLTDLNWNLALGFPF